MFGRSELLGGSSCNCREYIEDIYDLLSGKKNHEFYPENKFFREIDAIYKQKDDLNEKFKKFVKEKEKVGEKYYTKREREFHEQSLALDIALKELRKKYAKHNLL